MHRCGLLLREMSHDGWSVCLPVGGLYVCPWVVCMSACGWSVCLPVGGLYVCPWVVCMSARG